MEPVKILFHRIHPEAKLPTKAYPEDNCYDLYCVEKTHIPAGQSALVPVGLKVAYISPGFGFVIRGRSGLGFKYQLQPWLGEVDNGYKGSIDILVMSLCDKGYVFEKGDRVAQFKVEKVWDSYVAITDEVFESNRGVKGHGSSGK